MGDKDYYPSGSYNDPSALYNSVDLEPKAFDCIITHTLEKSIEVETENYRPFRDDEDGSVYYDTGDVDWVEDYDSQHLDIIELLEALQGLAKEKLEKCKDLSISEKNRLNRLIKEAGGWESIEKSVEEE